jgi:hypothetical protein
MSDKSIVLVMGFVAGMLLCLVIGLFVLAAGAPASFVAPAGPPPDAVIEVTITEDMVNRAFAHGVAGGAGAWSVDEGRIDLQPGNRVQFTARIGTPVGKWMVEGQAGIAVQDERLMLRILEARLGQLPLTGILRPFLPSIESRIEEEANRQLSERLARASLRLVGVTSDEAHLRLHLAG